MESTHKSKAVAALVALLIGGVVGGGIGYAAGNSMDSTTKDSKTGVSMNKNSSDNADGVMVGGALMVRDKDIVDNAVEANNVTTVVSLVKLAGLVDTLKSEGPFTVFAPNNDAFAALPAETVASLQKPENVESLKNILTYHVVAGTYTSADLRAMAAKGETLTTVQGQMLTPVLGEGGVWIQDESGNKVAVETADVISSNGVTHVIKSVLMPKS